MLLEPHISCREMPNEDDNRAVASWVFVVSEARRQCILSSCRLQCRSQQPCCNCLSTARAWSKLTNRNVRLRAISKACSRSEVRSALTSEIKCICCMWVRKCLQRSFPKGSVFGNGCRAHFRNEAFSTMVAEFHFRKKALSEMSCRVQPRIDTNRNCSCCTLHNALKFRTCLNLFL